MSKDQAEGISAQAAKVLEGLGGWDNILELQPCSTRIRAQLRDMNLVNEAPLRISGALGVVRAHGIVQIVMGRHSDNIAQAMTVLGMDKE